MFQKILFATTGTPSCDKAAHVAFDLAMKYKAKLVVFHVMGLPSRGFSPYVVDVRTGQAEDYGPDYVEWVHEELKTTYSRFIEDYADCDIATAAGQPHTEILRMARKMDADLILMGAHSRPDMGDDLPIRGIAGSTTQRVAKAARCPVMIVGRPCTTCYKYFSKVLFGTDFSKPALSAFQFARNVARESGSRLYLFHALDLSTMSSGGMWSQEELEEKIADARRSVRLIYESRMAGFKDYEVEIWEGIPYVEILKFARERRCDLIVMAHHTREVDPEKAVLGNTVEEVVLRATCPVVSVNRPDKLIDPAP